MFASCFKVAVLPNLTSDNPLKSLWLRMIRERISLRTGISILHSSLCEESASSFPSVLSKDLYSLRNKCYLPAWAVQLRQGNLENRTKREELALVSSHHRYQSQIPWVSQGPTSALFNKGMYAEDPCLEQASAQTLPPIVSEGRTTHFGKPKDVGKCELCTKKRFGKDDQQNTQVPCSP